MTADLPVPNAAIEEQPDAIVLFMTLWGEARGEGALGILAVAHVILNRMRKYAKTAREVCLQPLQFSCLNAADPNRPKLLMAHHIDPLSWGQCVAVGRLALLDLTEDPTVGATHYLTTALYKSAPPSWARADSGWKEHTTIGGQVFGVAA